MSFKDTIKAAPGEAMHETDMWHKLFAKLVPNSGNCKTLEGEMLRALAKIRYRYFNDGDYVNEGYGIETAGPAFMFLDWTQNCSKLILPELSILLDLLPDCEGGDYSLILDKMEGVLIKHIESKTVLTPNDRNMDMLNFQDEAFRRFGYPGSED
jgi:hypothetical protein